MSKPKPPLPVGFISSACISYLFGKTYREIGEYHSVCSTRANRELVSRGVVSRRRGYKKRDLEDRFFAMVKKDANSGGCWEWQGCKYPNGYGSMAVGTSRPNCAHRVSWLIHNGEWPKDQVLHKCDNRACVNPSHLFEGSQRDNIRDMMSKGRGRMGNPKVDSYIVGGMRFKYMTEAASYYGVTRQTIRNWLNGNLGRLPKGVKNEFKEIKNES